MAMTLSAGFPAFFPPPPAPLLYDDQADDPMYSDEEYQALMLAEFGPVVPLLAMAFEAAMKLTVTGDEAQAERCSKKRKKNQDDEIQTDRSSSKKKKNKDGETQPERSNKKRKKKDDQIQAPPSKRKRTEETEEFDTEFEEEDEPALLSPRSTNNMIATRLLKRLGILASELSESEVDGETHTVLWCECAGLPRGSPGCALHQHVPGRSWMLRHGDIPTVGGNDVVLVPKTSTDSRKLVARYMRWRRGVWMPSRFYLEKSQKERAYQDAEDEMKRLLGASVLPC